MKVLISIPPLYNGHELWLSLRKLKEKGIDYTVVSTSLIVEDEDTGDLVKLEHTVDSLHDSDVEKYDAFLLTSGSLKPVMRRWYNEKILRWTEMFNDAGKIVGAICISVPSVHRIAEGKRIAVFPLTKAQALLKQHGANLTGTFFEIDGNIITGESQMATEIWIEEIVDKLKEMDEHGED